MGVTFRHLTLETMIQDARLMRGRLGAGATEETYELFGRALVLLEQAEASRSPGKTVKMPTIEERLARLEQAVFKETDQ